MSARYLRDIDMIVIARHVISKQIVIHNRPINPLEPAMSAEMTPEAPKTLSVPHAGKRYFALSRGASYAAAARGELPTIRTGRKLRVPIIAVERMLEQVGNTAAMKRP